MSTEVDVAKKKSSRIPEVMSPQIPVYKKEISEKMFRLFKKSGRMRFMINGYYVDVVRGNKKQIKQIAKLKQKIKDLENKVK